MFAVAANGRESPHGTRFGRKGQGRARAALGGFSLADVPGPRFIGGHGLPRLRFRPRKPGEHGGQEEHLGDGQKGGGKKRPFVRSLAKNVNVRKGPGKEFGVVAQLGYLDEVAVTSKKIVRDENGYFWCKVIVGVSQNKFVEGWVCSKHCEGCWN